MGEPVPDLFVDGMMVNVSAYGCTLRFSRSIALDPLGPQPAEDAPLPSDHAATLRMTPEFLKGAIFVLSRYIALYEQDIGGKIPVPNDLIEAVGSNREQWDEFWK